MSRGAAHVAFVTATKCATVGPMHGVQCASKGSLVALGSLLWLLAGCSHAPAATRVQEPTATPTVSASASASASASPSSEPTAEAPAPSATVAPSAEPSATAIASAPPPPPVPTALEFRPGARPPRPRYGAHGAVRWAVLLAWAREGQGDRLQPLFAHLTQQRRYGASLAAPNCTAPVDGAYPSPIEPGENGLVLTVSFASEREMRAFVAALASPPAWTGRVRELCAD